MPFQKSLAIFLGLSMAVWPVYSLAQEVTPSPSPENSEAQKELAQNQEEIAAKQQEIQQLAAQIKKLQSRAATSANEAKIIASQLERIRKSLAKAELELKQTQLSIKTIARDQKKTQSETEKLEERIGAKKEQLKQAVRDLYLEEQGSLLAVWLTSNSFSALLDEQNNLKELQDKQIILLKELKTETEALKQHQADLEQQASDLAELRAMQAAQQGDLAQQKKEQADFLQAKKAEQLRYEQKIAEAEQAKKEIQESIFTLKNAGVKLSLKDATEMAKYASKLTGVRAALLLAVLKVESNMGTNLGGGHFPDDMQPQSREPFTRICAKLKLDPNTAPISARPRSFQGWGGAMGPAQIMPQTWEGIEAQVAQLMGKPVANPYELTDAFVGTAILLARAGAANPATEYEAVNRYLAGPNWQKFTWYGDRVLAVAKEYEAQGL